MQRWLGSSPKSLNSFDASRAAQSTLEAFPRISPSFCLWLVHMMCLNLQHRDHDWASLMVKGCTSNLLRA